MERRHYDASLEIRAEGDGRTIVGIAVPYDVEQRISPNLVEVFRKGVFRDVTRAANRVKLLFQHKTDAPIGRAAQPAELAPTYVFLADAARASYVSGAVVAVTGGRAL